MIKNNIPIEKKEKVLVSTLNGTFFHEKTNSGFIQINKIEGNSVQNGTPTPDNPIEVKSFDGEIVTSGKNLIDLSKAKANSNSSVKVVGDALVFNGGQTIDFDIHIPTGKTFIFNYTTSTQLDRDVFAVRFSDGSGSGEGTPSKPYKAPKDIRQLGIGITGSTTVSNLVISNIMLEIVDDEQTEPSAYEPFHATKTEKLTLRSLPNGVKDTLERQSDGSYLLTQKCKEFVLDGSENWSIKRSDSPAEKSVFELNDDLGVYYESKPSVQETETLFYYYSSIGEATFSSKVLEGIGGWSSNNVKNTEIMINLKTSRLATDDVNGLKAWLKANPVTCVMELIQPIQRKLWLSPLSAYEGQTNIFANSEVGAEMEVEVLTTNAVNEVIQSNNEYIKSQLYRKNLLINPNFMVNQRYRITRGDSAEADLNSNNYFSDCWKATTSVGMSSFKSFAKGGILIKNKSDKINASVVKYMMEQGERDRLNGKVCTLSICVGSNKTVISHSFVFDKNIRQNIYFKVDGSLDKIYTATSDINLYGSIEVGATLEPNQSAMLNWVKLEEGDTFTGYEEPNYDEELIKCRYFFQYNWINTTPVIVDKDKRISVDIAFKHPMRIKPTARFKTNLVHFVPIDGSTPILIDTAELLPSKEGDHIEIQLPNSISIPIAKVGTITRGESANIPNNFASGRAFIELNAEI